LSGQQARDDFLGFDTSEALIQTLELEGESFVVDPETMQNSGI
jgi:hypothetical protein